MIDQFGSNWQNVGQPRATFGQKSTKVGRTSPDVGQHRPELNRNGSMLAESWPSLGSRRDRSTIVAPTTVATQIMLRSRCWFEPLDIMSCAPIFSPRCGLPPFCRAVMPLGATCSSAFRRNAEVSGSLGTRWLCEVSLFARTFHMASLATASFAESLTLTGSQLAACIRTQPICVSTICRYARFLLNAAEREGIDLVSASCVQNCVELATRSVMWSTLPIRPPFG